VPENGNLFKPRSGAEFGACRARVFPAAPAQPSRSGPDLRVFLGTSVASSLRNKLRVSRTQRPHERANSATFPRRWRTAYSPYLPAGRVSGPLASREFVSRAVARCAGLQPLPGYPGYSTDPDALQLRHPEREAASGSRINGRYCPRLTAAPAADTTDLAHPHRDTSRRSHSLCDIRNPRIKWGATTAPSSPTSADLRLRLAGHCRSGCGGRLLHTRGPRGGSVDTHPRARFGDSSQGCCRNCDMAPWMRSLSSLTVPSSGGGRSGGPRVTPSRSARGPGNPGD
jgi:hypothetical protein